MPPRKDWREEALFGRRLRQQRILRARQLAISGALFCCSGVAALFAVILAFGTLLALAAGQYADDSMGLAFALTWDLATFVCAICTWRAAMKPSV